MNVRKARRWVDIIIPFVVSVIWCFISNVDRPSEDWLCFNLSSLQTMYDSKLSIGIVISVVGLIVIIIFIYFDNPQKTFLKEFLRNFIKSNFNGDFANYRVTIYKKSCGKLNMYCSESQPKNKFIAFPVVDDVTKANNIVSYCECSQMPITVNVDDIVEFYKNKDSELDNSQSQKVHDYIKKTHTSREMLPKIDRPSNHLYVAPIFDKDDSTWGAFLIDGISDSNDDVFEKVKENIDNTVKNIILFINKV